MPRQDRLGLAHTQIQALGDGWVTILYHQTPVVRFNDLVIELRSCGHQTVTVRNRTNQAANQFDLGFRVYVKKAKWWVELALKNDATLVVPYEDGLQIVRTGRKRFNFDHTERVMRETKRQDERRDLAKQRKETPV